MGGNFFEVNFFEKVCLKMNFWKEKGFVEDIVIDVRRFRMI